MFGWLFKKQKHYADEWEIDSVKSWSWKQGERPVGYSIMILLKSKTSSKTTLIKLPSANQAAEWPEIQHELMTRYGIGLTVDEAGNNHEITLAE